MTGLVNWMLPWSASLIRTMCFKASKPQTLVSTSRQGLNGFHCPSLEHHQPVLQKTRCQKHCILSIIILEDVIVILVILASTQEGTLHMS